MQFSKQKTWNANSYIFLKDIFFHHGGETWKYTGIPSHPRQDGNRETRNKKHQWRSSVGEIMLSPLKLELPWSCSLRKQIRWHKANELKLECWTQIRNYRGWRELYWFSTAFVKMSFEVFLGFSTSGHLGEVSKLRI